MAWRGVAWRGVDAVGTDGSEAVRSGAGVKEEWERSQLDEERLVDCAHRVGEMG